MRFVRLGLATAFLEEFFGRWVEYGFTAAMEEELDRIAGGEAAWRKAMVCEARGETVRAIEYCERTIAWMDAHPENFDPESREPFYEDIQRLRASLRGAC